MSSQRIPLLASLEGTTKLLADVLDLGPKISE